MSETENSGNEIINELEKESVAKKELEKLEAYGDKGVGEIMDLETKKDQKQDEPGLPSKAYSETLSELNRIGPTTLLKKLQTEGLKEKISDQEIEKIRQEDEDVKINRKK